MKVLLIIILLCTTIWFYIKRNQANKYIVELEKELLDLLLINQNEQIEHLRKKYLS
jgi:hypothetical protein